MLGYYVISHQPGKRRDRSTGAYRYRKQRINVAQLSLEELVIDANTFIDANRIKSASRRERRVVSTLCRLLSTNEGVADGEKRRFLLVPNLQGKERMAVGIIGAPIEQKRGKKDEIVK